MVSERIAAGIHRHWEVTEVLFRNETRYQRMLIGKTAQGVSLFCNDERQSTEATERIYHEGQLIPALLLAERLDRVLVIGSSEGVVSQVAIEAGAKEVVHVDIDEECVRVCADLLPYGYTPDDVARATAGDGPIRLHFGDGKAFVEACAERGDTFDVIVMHLPDETPEDPGAQHNVLYGTEFLEQVRKALSPGGAFITQAGCSTFWRNETLRQSWKRMKSVFPTAVYFEMEEQDWAWIVGCADRRPDPVAEMVRRWGSLPYRPAFIDELSIVKATIPPVSLRKEIRHE